MSVTARNSASVSAIGGAREGLDSFDLLDRWSRFLVAKGHAEKTVEMYTGELVRMILRTGFRRLEELTEDQAAAYVQSRPPNGSGRTTALRALRSFYAWATDRGYVGQNPVRDFTPKEQKYGPPPYLTPDEVRRVVLAGAYREERRGWTFTLLYVSAARISSACALTRDDLHGDQLYFRVAKGRKPYSVPLGRAGLAAVEGLMIDGRDTLIGVGPERVRQWLNQARIDTGIKVWPHLFRHSAATHWVERGADVRTVQTLGNWSSLEMVERYAGVSDSRKREVVELLG